MRAALLLALLASPALAQDEDLYAPCLAAHDSVEDYAQALEAAGWTREEGAAREEAAQGPAEVYWRFTRLPEPETTLAELEENLARVRDWAQANLQAVPVLTRDGVSVIVALRPGEPRSVICLFAAPDLPLADRMLGTAEPGPYSGGFANVSLRPPSPPGTLDLVVEAMRIHREVEPAEPLPGTESVMVGFALEEG